MEKVPRSRSHWKIERFERSEFKAKFCFYFNEIFPDFGKEIKNELFPLYLKIFGKPLEKEYARAISTISPQSYFLLKRDYESLSFEVEFRSKQSETSNALIKTNCRNFIDKSHEILNKYRLISDKYDFAANRWLIHSFYCSVATGKSVLIKETDTIYVDFSKELMADLWKDLPKNQKDKVLEETAQYFKKETLLPERYEESYGQFLENWETYFDSFLSPKFLPPPISFDFESYDLWEDLKQYEERAVEAYREHLKKYLQTIQEALKKHDFKRNKKEDYEQVKWLILWNKYDFEELADMVPVISDYCKINVSYDAVRKAFNKLKKYNLPIRPYGKKRKNLTP
jgi:hypothetical protein